MRFKLIGIFLMFCFVLFAQPTKQVFEMDDKVEIENLPGLWILSKIVASEDNVIDKFFFYKYLKFDYPSKYLGEKMNDKFVYIGKYSVFGRELKITSKEIYEKNEKIRKRFSNSDKFIIHTLNENTLILLVSDRKNTSQEVLAYYKKNPIK